LIHAPALLHVRVAAASLVSAGAATGGLARGALAALRQVARRPVHLGGLLALPVHDAGDAHRVQIGVHQRNRTFEVPLARDLEDPGPPTSVEAGAYRRRQFHDREVAG